ncbi:MULTISPECIES: hypothetical protein [unclassified Rhizobium]|nr:MULTISPECIES: hypothetical protein [unclassified Rhizobium]
MGVVTIRLEEGASVARVAAVARACAWLRRSGSELDFHAFAKEQSFGK